MTISHFRWWYREDQLSAKKNLLLINFKAQDQKDYNESLGQKNCHIILLSKRDGKLEDVC